MIEPTPFALRARTPFFRPMALARQFRFLFPRAPAGVVHEAAGIERRLLHRLLGSRPAHLLRHPYPVRLDSLVAPIQGVLSARGEDSR